MSIDDRTVNKDRHQKVLENSKISLDISATLCYTIDVERRYENSWCPPVEQTLS